MFSVRFGGAPVELFGTRPLRPGSAPRRFSPLSFDADNLGRICDPIKDVWLLDLSLVGVEAGEDLEVLSSAFRELGRVT